MTANPHKGEVSIKIDGASYTLKMSSNAICVAEKVSGQTMSQLAAGLGDGSFLAIRSMFMAALSSQFPALTLEQAGDLMDNAGIERVTTALLEAFALAFPKQEGGEANPTKPGQAGTG